jgi:hypothetical protein
MWQGETLIRQATNWTWSPSEGYTFLPQHSGTKESVLALAKNYRNYRLPHSFHLEDGVAKLEAEHQLPDDGSAETPSGSWAISASPETVDFRQHSKFLALSEDEQAFIGQRISGKIDFSPTEAADGVVWDDESTFAIAGDALFFYTLACNDQLHFQRHNWTLRHSMTVSQMYTANLIGDNIDRVYTKAQLLAECAAFDDPLPPRYVSQVNAIVFNPAAKSGYLAGWLKRMATDETVAGDRCQCSIEYVLEFWPTIFYPAL